MEVGFMYVSSNETTGSSTGESARLPNSAFHLFGSGSEMGVARVQLAPGIQDGDDRFADIIFVRIPHLLDPRPMSKGSQVVRSEPSVTA